MPVRRWSGISAAAVSSTTPPMATLSTPQQGWRPPTSSWAPASVSAPRSPMPPGISGAGRSAISCCAGAANRSAPTSRCRKPHSRGRPPGNMRTPLRNSRRAMRRRCRPSPPWSGCMPTTRWPVFTSSGCSMAARASACNWNRDHQRMPETTRDFSAGSYRFIPAGFQYSSGAAAASGYEIERVRFDKMPSLADGFAQIANYIQAAGRPLTSFCACELRSPAAFTEDGFRRFNEHYVKTLAEWKIFDGTTNPVARSNVCPEIDPPAEPSFYAFSFTRPGTGAAPSFVIAGGAELGGGSGTYPERIVRYRDLSSDGLQEKVRFTVGSMQERLGEFGYGWKDTTAVQAYSVHDFHPVIADELVRRGAVRSGLTWHFARPPVVDLEFEMDCRRVARETAI